MPPKVVTLDIKNSPVSIKSNSVIKIRKINIYESPILSVRHNNTTVHIVLDTGATASLISLAKAKELKLKIAPTKHRAIQVDGISNLVVMGETHTCFQRGNLDLQFSGLVVNDLGTDVLGGTNFHYENDIYSRMAKDTIVIQGNNCFQSTPVEIVKLDEQKSTAKLISVKKSQVLLPGDEFEVELPPACPSEGVFMIEPKYHQGDICCLPQIAQAKDNKLKVIIKDNKNHTPIKMVKNSKPIQIREMDVYCSTDGKFGEPKIKYFKKFKDTIPVRKTTTKDVEDMIAHIKIDQAGTMQATDRKQFENTLRTFSDVLGNDLPGYNNYFGVVHASINFASRARPTAHKTRMPSYGDHGQKLYNQKALEMVEKGVLIDPYEYGIQPTIVNDAWVVKKQKAAYKKWEECTADDVRMVTGFDPVNKYLSPIPSKANDPMMIYTHLASWNFLGELDFADFYWQLKFNMQTMKEKRQLGYLCIRTVGGVLAYARGPNGLLGMDAVCDQLTDKLFGDLVLQGKVVKLADNLYFGGETISELHSIFHEIMRRCHLSNLRIKPQKISINIANADILGLHWDKGTLKPSAHKLEPLATCERPKTVKALRSFLGGVRFNEVCLDSKKLADATELLDELTPANRSGKDLIEWNERQVAAFEDVQDICKNPVNVYVPKKGDNLYLVGDAAPSKGPGIGTKLLIQRKGTNKILPSFNYGCRMKNMMKDWSPCEVEAFQLSQAIKKFKPFLRFVGTKTTALIDSRASVLAVQRLENGKPSTNKRLQDLLTNISAENIKVKHISAKLASPILEYVDFASRNPVNCENDKCTICEDSKHPDITFFGNVSINLVSGQPEIDKVPQMSIPVWKQIQQSSDDLRKVVALLESGKQPHKKAKKMNDVRKYLRDCTLNRQGLLVAKNDDKNQPFLRRKNDRIVIPKEFSYSYATILHRQLNHPLPSQMLKQFNRHFFMLNDKEIIKEVTERCEYPCKAMKKLPKETFSYETETKAEEAGIYFNADVMREAGQKIFVLRDNLTSFTDAKFVQNETKPSLREAILVLISKLRMNKSVTIRVDAQSSLKSLKNDTIILEELIGIDVGKAKNKNKNSVAEKGIRELREEIVRLAPHGGQISETLLAKAVRNLNARIRHSGYSARELWTKRDQITGTSLEFEDKDLSDLQHKMRVKSHDSSAKYESRNASKVKLPQVKIGDRVFIKSDGEKNKIREEYFILRFVPNKNEVEVQKIGKKKNILSVQLQNIMPVQSIENSSDDEDEKIKEKISSVSDRKTHLIMTSLKECQYCYRLKRWPRDHHYTACDELSKIRPISKHSKREYIETSSSDEGYEQEDVISVETGTSGVDTNSVNEEESNVDISTNDAQIQNQSINVAEDNILLQDTGRENTNNSQRDRLYGRSLPGRSIEDRNLTLDLTDLRDPRSIEGRLAHTGDVIRYFTGDYKDDKQIWLKATVQKMYKTVQRRHPTFYNIIDETGKEQSIQLLSGSTTWQLLRNGRWEYVTE